MAWAARVQVGDAAAKLVLIALANHAKADGSASWPGQKVLAEYAEVTTRTVRTKLDYLQERGLIRPGDQQMVEHIRANYRPQVWDLIMLDSRVETLSPLTSLREEEISPLEEVQGGNLRTPGRKTVSTNTSLNKEDSLRSSSARATRLDPKWIPEPDLIEQMRKECPTLDLKAEHLKFIDYWIARPGQGGTKLDWRATWRNWMRKEAETRAPANGRANGMPVPKPIRERIVCKTCFREQDVCRKTKAVTGDDHEWEPQTVKA
jgi:hypothetical protein